MHPRIPSGLNPNAPAYVPAAQRASAGVAAPLSSPRLSSPRPQNPLLAALSASTVSGSAAANSSLRLPSAPPHPDSCHRLRYQPGQEREILRELIQLEPKVWAHPLRVDIVGQPGCSNRLARERLMLDMIHFLMAPERGLFNQTSGGYRINCVLPQSSVKLEELVLLGRLLGRAMREGIATGLAFAPEVVDALFNYAMYSYCGEQGRLPSVLLGYLRIGFFDAIPAMLLRDLDMTWEACSCRITSGSPFTVQGFSDTLYAYIQQNDDEVYRFALAGGTVLPTEHDFIDPQFAYFLATTSYDYLCQLRNWGLPFEHELKSAKRDLVAQLCTIAYEHNDRELVKLSVEVLNTSTLLAPTEQMLLYFAYVAEADPVWASKMLSKNFAFWMRFPWEQMSQEFRCQIGALVEILPPAVAARCDQVLLPPDERPHIVVRAAYFDAAWPFDMKWQWLVINSPRIVQSLFMRFDPTLIGSCPRELTHESSPPNNWLKDFRIAFTDQDGIDQGGVTRAWFSQLAQQFYNPSFGFCELSPNDTGYCSFTNLRSGDSQRGLAFFGRVVAKAVTLKISLGIHFAPHILKHLVAAQVGGADLRAWDLSSYRFLESLDTLTEEEIKELDLSFVVSQESLGKYSEVELKPDGATIAVTRKNYREYRDLITRYYLEGKNADGIKAFAQGFYQVIPGPVAQQLSWDELGVMIAGEIILDTRDWYDHSQYFFLAEQRERARLSAYAFWRIVDGMTQIEKRMLLKFVTGRIALPPGGFSALEPSFNIQFTESDNRALPTSHTCFNQLDLPMYESAELMEAKLRQAITENGDYVGSA